MQSSPESNKQDKNNNLFRLVIWAILLIYGKN